MVVMSCGLTFMVGMGLNALFGYKDVQVNPNKRGSKLTYWGDEERRGVVYRFAEFKGGVAKEGQGVNHEEWQKKKEEYMKK